MGDYKQEMRARVIDLAREILDGRSDLLAGSRLLVGALWGAGLAETEAGRVIVGFEDELAGVPDPAKRPLYAEDYLRRVDASAERYLEVAGRR